jgi:hypothetical protein
MSDPSPPKPAPAPKGPIGIVRGTATRSTWLENNLAAREHQRKIDLAEADAETAAVKRAETTPGEAGITSTADMGRPGTNPVVVIESVSSDGRRHQFIQADLTVTEAADGPALQLNLICIQCVSNGVPQAQAQIRISDKNKRLSVNQDTKGEIWVDPDTGAALLLAGTVELDEICRCPMPGCGFRFRISPRGPQRGVSRLMVE